MTRTFYLSFADQTFLGACVVDVTEDDARAARTVIALNFPNARDGAEWVGAASTVAHRHGCNPGGEMMALDITDSEQKAWYPRNRLLSKAELEAIAPIVKVGDRT